MAKIVFKQCENGSKQDNEFDSFRADSFAQYQSGCRKIEAKFRSQVSRSYSSTTSPPSWLTSANPRTATLPDGSTVALEHYLVYTAPSNYKPDDPFEEGKYFDYLEDSGITSKSAVLANLRKNFRTISRDKRRNIAARYELRRKQKDAGLNIAQGMGADTSGMSYGEVWKALEGKNTLPEKIAAIRKLRPGMSKSEAFKIRRSYDSLNSTLAGTSQDFSVIKAQKGDITRTDAYSRSLDNTTPTKNGAAFSLGTVGQLARDMLEGNSKFDLRSEDFRDVIAAKFGVGSREAGYYQKQYLDQTPNMASLLSSQEYKDAPENIVGYNQALRELPQDTSDIVQISGAFDKPDLLPKLPEYVQNGATVTGRQVDPSKLAFQRQAFNFDPNERVWRELKKAGIAGGFQGKRATSILQQLIQTMPGASQDYIIEQARKFDPNIGEQSFKSRFQTVRDAAIDRGLFVDNDEAGQRIVDTHLRAQELAGKSDEDKLALYNRLEESGQITGFKSRKASAIERANPFSAYNRRKNELERGYLRVEEEKNRLDADYAVETDLGKKKQLKEKSEQAGKKLEEINADLDRIKEGYAEWLSDSEKLNLINEQIIKTLEQTSEAIDPGTGKADTKYQFDSDVQKTIDASGKESTVIEGAGSRRTKRSSIEERETNQSPALKAYLETVEKKNEARVASWSQTGAKVGSLFGTKGGNLGASIGGSAAKLVGAFSTLATGVGVVVAAGQLLAAGFNKLYGAAEAAVNKMLEFSKYNGNLLASNILHKGREFRRNLQFASETAGSGSALINAYDDFQDEIQPLKIAWQKFKNTVGKWFLEVATSLMKAVNYILKFYGILNLANNMGKQSEMTSGRFTVPGSSDSEGSGGSGGSGGGAGKGATKPGKINVDTGDYTAYDEGGKMVTKKEQARNKAVAKEYAKKLGVDLKDVQDNDEFNWRLANLQKVEQAKDGEKGLRGLARKGVNFVSGVNDKWVSKTAKVSGVGLVANKSLSWATGAANKMLDKSGKLGLTDEEIKQANSGKRVRAIENAAGIVNGEIKGELGLSLANDILKEEGNYSKGGQNLKFNENTKAISYQAQLYKTFYDSERKTGKGVVDEAMLRMLNPEGMKKDRQGTIDAFIKNAKQNRQENELAIFYDQTVNRAGDKSAEWKGYQTLDPEKMSKSALEDLAASSGNQAIKLDAVARYLEQMLGYNRDIADNTRPKEDIDPTTDLIFGMMGKLASRSITDPGAPQGVDMSSYSDENKQYGRFAGQRTTTYWGRPENKK